MSDLFEAEQLTTTSLDLRRLQRQAQRRKRRMITAVLTVVGLVVFALGASVALNFLSSFEKDEVVIADYEGAGQGRVQVVIEPGDSGAKIADRLFESDVIASTQAFLDAASKNAEAATIKPGYYWMQKKMKAEYALLALLDPDRRDVRKMTIPEGKTVDYYLQRIADLTEFSLDEVTKVAADTEALGLPAEAGGNLEGWLFASTYEFNPGATPADVLSTMIKQTIKVLDQNGVAAEDRQRVLTIASLIEREAKKNEDRPLISGVIHNRLERNHPLELDSTLKYAFPSEGVFVPQGDMQKDSPYNTHRNAGLPPTPIAGPGEASIQAAILPAEHDYMFFVTVNLDSGDTLYAVDHATHVKNTALLHEWIRQNQATE